MDKDSTSIILASASPRRKELLKLAGFDFEIITADVDENICEKSANEMVKELSFIKAKAVFDKILADPTKLSKDTNPQKDILIIGADTVVTLNNKILGKPKDRTDAFNMINMLQNNTHQVFTGVTLIKYSPNNSSMIKETFCVCTDVVVYPISEEEINNYIDLGDCFDKAGAYGIQGPFTVHIEKINGDYFNVVGLPVSRLYKEIQKM